MTNLSMYEQLVSSHLNGSNAAYVEDMYEQWLLDPSQVPSDWRDCFEKLPRVSDAVGADTPHSPVRAHFAQLARNRGRVRETAGADQGVYSEHEDKQVKVQQMITAFRVRGHQAAKLDPLDLLDRKSVSDLTLEHHGLAAGDLDVTFKPGDFEGLARDELVPLKTIYDGLQTTYCGSIGVEFTHITSTAQRKWIQQRMESVKGRPSYDGTVKEHLLERLTAAEGLEKILAARYPGTKRFGLEGGESLIVSLDEIIQRSGSYGAKEIVIGMAHRGRLNVLVNTFGKNPSELFEEFEGRRQAKVGSGDVKYHQGFSSNVMTPGGEVHLALAFNPSHLEIVAPVVEGSVRARQDRRGDQVGDRVVPVIIHGDAAFAGQGVVMETFQMSRTRGYGTGGTAHLVVNNQVGFTTSKRQDARSTEYCTDVAKMVQAPIFHVNADDPEAVYFVTQLAVDYRAQFKRDVVVDLICYRRLGHNEADEPAITQPLMYQVIRSLPTVRKLYADKLVNEGVLANDQPDRMVDEFRDALESGDHVLKSLVRDPDTAMFVDWSPYVGHDWIENAPTSVDEQTIRDLTNTLYSLPDGFVPQRQVNKIIEDRRKMAVGGLAMDWGFAETMAYATLLNEGYPVRLTGQDVGRGTFSHRHAVMHGQSDGAAFCGLRSINPEGASPQRHFEIYDSFLSEEAVLGFEYGYATTLPKTLVIWEAQFGDFANGAQVVIDQFISSGELKWERLCGLTLLLPHGYEGQGPEHSSARLERFLQLCAQTNIQVCVPTTPAQVFHMLRRQAIRPLRKPLVVMSPKSLLRHKLAKSTIDDLANGQFELVLDDPYIEDGQHDAVEQVILCSGKVFYDAHEHRVANEVTNTAIVRIEQLYPFPEDRLEAVLKQYPNLRSVVWCQEEPQNQGAWYCSQHHMHRVLARVDQQLKLRFAGRAGSAAPACGYMSVHVDEQKALLERAFAE